MNTRTGEIVSLPPGAPVPAECVPLGNLPVANCPLCKGRGHNGKLVRCGKRGHYRYRPCVCTNPETL